MFTSASAFTITRAAPASIQLAASNGTDVFTAIVLPAGMTLNASTGLITGTTYQSPVTYDIECTATNEYGTTMQTVTITIIALAVPVITSPSMAQYIPYVPFSYQVTTNVFANVELDGAEELPSGLSFNPVTKVISGTSTVATISITIYAINASGQDQITLTNDTEPPTVPQNLNATNVTSTSLRLNWEPATDNVGWGGMYISKDGAAPVLYTNNLPYYNASGLVPGSTHTWKIKARDSSGNTSDYSNEIEVTMLS